MQQSHQGWWEGNGFCVFGLGHDLGAEGWSPSETRDSRTAGVERVWEGRKKEACEGVFRAVLEGSCPSESKQECSCSCWAIAPQKAAGTRSPPYKGREGFTKQLQ